MLQVKNNRLIDYGNRGMSLENDINMTNDYYLTEGIALIYKKPTPIKVIRTSLDKTHILDAFYEKKSTLDYNGIYKGKYIEFDAKETNSKTSFPLSNIHEHQLEHIKNVIKYGGIAFLIIRFNLLSENYILYGETLLNFIRCNNRKSIPIDFFKENCKLISIKYRPRIDYLKIIDYNYIYNEGEIKIEKE